jgi:hypothetical protein
MPKPEDDAVFVRRREAVGFFTGSDRLILSGFDAAARAITATGCGGAAEIFSLGREESWAGFFNACCGWVVSVANAPVVAAAAGFCMAGVVGEKKCLFIADGSETRRL